MSPEIQTVCFLVAVACLLWAATPWPRPDGRIRFAAFGSAAAWLVFLVEAFYAARNAT